MQATLIAAYAAKMGATPEQATAEITRVVLHVASNVARNFVFGYHSEEDARQQGVLFALQALDSGRYDVARPLENFLHVHVKNRLHNFKRDHFVRAEAPCKCCEAFGNPADPCPRWVVWNRRNLAKRNLMRPLDVASLAEAMVSPAREDAGSGEILGLIEAGLTAELRSDYLRMRAGVAVPKQRRQKVREAVLALVGPSLMESD